MMKCKDRIIPDTDNIDVMGIIKLIEMDLESVRRNHLVGDGSLTIFISERLLLRLAQWKYKWMHLGFLDLKFTVDVGGHKDIEVNGQIFGCEMRLLHQWEMDIANAYRIQFEEASFIPLNPGAPSLAVFHRYIDPDEWKWSVCSKGMEPKYIERFNTKEFVDGIIANYNNALINGIHGTLLDDIKMEDKLMRDTDLAFRRFFDSKAPIVKAYFDIEKIVFNGPATIVIWKDKTKTVVKCEEGTTYSKEEAIDQAILKKLFTTNSHHKRVLKDLINEKSVEQIDKKKLKKEHSNYVLETIKKYIKGVTDDQG